MDTFKQAYLDIAGKQCIDELKTINIPLAEKIIFEPTTKGTRWGLAYYTWKGYKSEINDLLLDGHHWSELKEVLMHELLHTCRGCNNHKEEWLKLADIVNTKLGYHVKEHASCEEMNIPQEQYERNMKYVLTCIGCLRQIKRERWCKTIREYKEKRCEYCGCMYVLTIKGE